MGNSSINKKKRRLMPLLCFTLCKHCVSATQTLFQLILSAGLQERHFYLYFTDRKTKA